jgi:hypothetical protein
MNQCFSTFLTPCLLSGVAILASSAVSPAAAFELGYKEYQNPVGNPSQYEQTPAVGITSSDIGNSFTVDWSLSPENDNVDIDEELQATGKFTVNDFRSDQLDLTVDVTNTTAPSFQAAIVSMGWGVQGQDASPSMGSKGETFQNVTAAKNFPGGFKDFDACISATKNCNGGNIKKGLQSGSNSDSFQVSLAGDFGDNPSTYLQDFGMKFQSEQGSYQLAGETTEKSASSGILYYNQQEIPEPSAGLGLLVVAGSFSLWYHRQNRRSIPKA